MAEGADPSLEATRRRLDRYRAHQAEHGFSKWLLEEKDSGAAIGDAGLLVLEDGAIDLGYRLVRSRWGRGLATEVAHAWLQAAFGSLGLERVTAFAHHQNTASLRVLEKVGFRSQGRKLFMGVDAVTYSLTAEEHGSDSGPNT